MAGHWNPVRMKIGTIVLGLMETCLYGLAGLAVFYVIYNFVHSVDF